MDDDDFEDPGDFVLSKALFTTEPCGCFLPKWKKIEWRDQEAGHRYLRYVGTGLSKAGKVTKRRKYGQWYGCRTIQLFVEMEYANELDIYQQRQAFSSKKRKRGQPASVTPQRQAKTGTAANRSVR